MTLLKTNFSLFIILFFSSSFLYSQAFNWAIGSEMDAKTEMVTVDEEGNFYKTGSYNGVDDLDPGIDELVIDSPNSAYLLKINSDGNLEWAKVFSGGFSKGYSVAVDTDGNSYILGHYDGVMDADPNDGEELLPYSPEGTTFIIKLDSDGEFIWERHLEGEHEEVYTLPRTISVNNLGHVFISGEFSNGLLDANPNSGEVYLHSYTNSPSDFLIKLNTVGDFIWGEYIAGVYYGDGPPDPPFINDAELDEEGNVFITGTYHEETDFEPGVGLTIINPPFSTASSYILKLNNAGGIEWVNSFSTENESSEVLSFQGIALDEYGAVYATGFFNTETDFDAGIGISSIIPNNQDVFILKSNAMTGDFIWVKTIGNDLDEKSYDITVNSSFNEILITGSVSSSSIDFDPSPGVDMYTTMGGEDIFVESISYGGSYNWARIIGSSDADVGLFVGTDISNNIYLNGNYNGVVDFNFDSGEYLLDQTELGDLFFMKITDTCEFETVYSEISFTRCDPFVVPSGDETYYESGIYTDTIPTLTGCNDSIITFNLTIDELEEFTLFQDDSLLFVEPTDLEYQWINCLTGETIDGATSSTYLALEDGSYAVIVSNGFCSETSDCIIIGCIEETVYSEISITACESFTVASGDETYFESGVYMDTIASVSCADSIITYDITIDALMDVAILQDGIVLSADLDGLTYQWINCDAEFSEIDGATEQDYTVLDDGAYAVIVSNGTCIDTSDCFVFLYYSIPEDNRSKIIVYPNPTKGELTIVLDQINSATTVNIRTVNGQLVYTNKYENEQSISVNFEGANGLYILEIKMENEAVYFAKFLKED